MPDRTEWRTAGIPLKLERAEMMRTIIWVLIGLTTLSTISILPSRAETRMWAAKGDLKRRTCPSLECGIVGNFYFRESILVYQVLDGWSRISRYKTAGCHEGISAFVQSGRNDCSKENGISGGKFAEWVRSEFLVDKKPNSGPEIQG